jgi:hypothetical protein
MYTALIDIVNYMLLIILHDSRSFEWSHVGCGGFFRERSEGGIGHSLRGWKPLIIGNPNGWAEAQPLQNDLLVQGGRDGAFGGEVLADGAGDGGAVAVLECVDQGAVVAGGLAQGLLGHVAMEADKS